MEDMESVKMNIDVATLMDLVNKSGKYVKYRKGNNISAQKSRAKKKEALKKAQNARVLRVISRLNHSDIVVSDELKEISKLNIADRKIAVQKKFQTI